VPERQPKGKRKLTVTDCVVLQEWDSGKGDGKKTTLWEIKAVDEHGAPINEKLRSFAELEVGVLIEYEVEKYVHEKHGVSYTLKRPRQNTKNRVEALEKQVADLTDRVSALEAGRGITPPERPAESEEEGDDGIPF
jgi:hypothetical protein